MRCALLFLLLSIVSCRVPKTLEGEYYESFGAGWGGATYSFHKDGTFEYAAHYDVGGLNGKGHYSITARKWLQLDFSGDSLYTGPSTVAVVPDSLPGDDWHLEMILLEDTTLLPLVGAPVLICDTLGKKIAQSFTDLDGKTTISNPGYHGPIVVTMKYVGFQPVSVRIDRPGAYNLTGRLYFSGLSSPPPGTTWNYTICDYREDVLVIKPNKSVADGIGRSTKTLARATK